MTAPLSYPALPTPMAQPQRFTAFGAMPASRYPSASWWERPVTIPAPFVHAGYAIVPGPYGAVDVLGIGTAIQGAAMALDATVGNLLRGKQAKQQSQSAAQMQTQELLAQQQMTLVGSQTTLAQAASQERMLSLALGGGLLLVTIAGGIALLKPRGEVKKNPRKRRSRR